MNNATYVIESFRAERGCCSYIIWCQKTLEAVIVDPSAEVKDLYESYLKYLKENKLSLVYCIDTHTHADHKSASPDLRREFPDVKIIMHVYARSSQVDDPVVQYRIIRFGIIALNVLYVPGHTNDSIALVTDDGSCVFTGDTLLIGNVGRTDLRDGNSEDLFYSLQKLREEIPNKAVIYPGHAYVSPFMTTMAEQKKSNPYLQMDKKHFIQHMNNLKPPKPELYETAIRENSR